MTSLSTPFLPADATAIARCAHCGQAVPRGLIDPSVEMQFCCTGCEAVYQAITGCGLAEYYRLRESAGETFAPVVPAGSRFDAFDAPAFEKLYVTRMQDGVCSVDLALENVSCAACVWLIERLPGVIDGVISARLSLRDATVQISWDRSHVPLSRIARTLDRFGYRPHPARGIARRELHRREERGRLIRLGVSGALMGNTMLLALALYAGDRGGMDPATREFFRWLSVLLGIVALAWPGSTFFRSAWTAIRVRRLNLDVPIALALLAGGVGGLANVMAGRGDVYFDSLSVLVFLLLVGRYLQFRQQRKADDAVELLFNMTPATCRIVRGADAVEAPIEALNIGDEVEVRPGELVPADGQVVSGRSGLDQALLTGESSPVRVEPGDSAYAGSLNVGSILRIRVSATGEQTRIGRLMKLVERGVSEKPPIVQFADRVGAWFTLGVTLASAGTFALWATRGDVLVAVDHTVALLIVTCPCVLGLATPLTIAVAIGRLARWKMLVKSGAALETLAARGGGTILLDKTGTITCGAMSLVRWVGDAAIQPVVALVESRSTHPIARALCGSLPSQDDLRLLRFTETTGAGVSAVVQDDAAGGCVVQRVDIGSPAFIDQMSARWTEDLRAASAMAEGEGLTTVAVVVDGVVVAVAALGDRPRADSPVAIATLRKLGWRPVMISGDAPGPVRSVARAVGIDDADAHAGVSPERKLAIVRETSSRGVSVMVGDGVNDAAGLAAAKVGIAVHGGAEASLAAADVYVASPGLSPLVNLIAMARRTMRVIRRNLLVSLSYNLMAGTLAVMGLMTPLLAAIIMPVSSATVLSLAVAAMSRPVRRYEGGRG